jgi:hypothetical protein
MYSYLKGIVSDKLLKHRQSFLITLYKGNCRFHANSMKLLQCMFRVDSLKHIQGSISFSCRVDILKHGIRH